ncbi:SulP family inorganic anion transporter [Longispora albida]|uniref:SulP family inorganic anion transporter n=1 Tax=Longispora albida TaxID=203523 RepID=UPI0003664821|nr:SulP family inorganic anion transporter [Longispora albida]
MGVTGACRRAAAGLLPAGPDLASMARQPGRNLVSGVTVAVVALPLALGFGMASGLGAAAGLATAIVAGAVAAVAGGSHLSVTGPTGAMTVVLAPIAASHGPPGVLTVGLLAGLVLLGLAIARAGRYARYVPAPVMEGFTLGLAGVIFLQQLPAALGVASSGSPRVLVLAANAVLDFAAHPRWPEILLAGAVAVTMLTGARWWPAIPFSLVAVTAATVAAKVLGLPVAHIGQLPATPPAPSLGFLDPVLAIELLPSALAIAVLAALESLLSATVADNMSGTNTRHDPDRELFGQSLANLAAPLFGGLPAAAAVARTAVNVRSGATTRLSALAHALTLALIMLAAAPLVAEVPLAALAGVLLATAIRMVQVRTVRSLAKAGRSDAFVLGLTAAATLALDLVMAVMVGVLAAGALALRTITRTVRVDPLRAEEHIVAYRIDGPLFFAAAERFVTELSRVADVRVVILRMSRVSTIDATGALALRDAIRQLEQGGISVYMSGIRPEHHRALTALGVLDRLREAGRLFSGTSKAIMAARSQLE